MIFRTNTFSYIEMWFGDISWSVWAREFGRCARSWSRDDRWSRHWSNRMSNYHCRVWIDFWNWSKGI
jgi:hypothetical protein